MSSAAATHAQWRPRRRFRRYAVFRALMIVLVIFIFIAPLVWMTLASFKTNVDIHNVRRALVFTPTLENYIDVFRNDRYLRFVFNSLWVAAWATCISLLIGVPAAYSMNRYGMARSAVLVLLARIVPGICLLVPWYYLFARAGLVGSYTALILSHMFILIPVSLYVLMSFFASLPKELEEAALVDGLTPIGAFLRILLPLAVPGIATAGILSFIFSWNNFMFALVLSGRDTKTLPPAIFDFVSYSGINWGAIMAGSVVMTIPIIVVALFSQKYIVSGLTAGATKG